MWLPGKRDFPINLTSLDSLGTCDTISCNMWLRKYDIWISWFHGLLDFADCWIYWFLGFTDASLRIVTSWKISLHEKFDFLGNVISRERWLFGKCDFPGNVTSREIILPGNYDFPGNVTSWEMWFPGKCDFPVNVSSSQIWLPGKWCEFLGNVTSWGLEAYEENEGVW